MSLMDWSSSLDIGVQSMNREHQHLLVMKPILTPSSTRIRSSIS
jgi:hypothetical protein